MYLNVNNTLGYILLTRNVIINCLTNKYLIKHQKQKRRTHTMSQNNNNNYQGQSDRNNNQRNGITNNQKSTQRSTSISNTLVELEPSAVVYQIEATDIENFVHRLFKEQGFNALAVRTKSFRQTGQQRMVISAIFDRNDKNFMGSLTHIPAHLRDRLDTEGYQVSDEMSEYLSIFIGNADPKIVTRKGHIIVELNIFHCIGIMLDAKPGIHDIAINDIINHQKKSIITVSKRYASNNNNNHRRNKGDKYADLI